MTTNLSRGCIVGIPNDAIYYLCALHLIQLYMFSALVVFLKGIIMGLSVSAPPGPNAMLMINRTLRKGHLSGFLTGMGVATADTIFAVIAGLSFSYIIGFINEKAFYIKLIAGILVAIVGIWLFFHNPVWELRRKRGRELRNSHLQDYISVFVMALANPFSIFIFLALFPGMNVSFSGPGRFIPLIIVGGVFLGASSWWLIFSYTVSRFSRTLSLRSIVTLNRITSLVIVSIGVAVLITLFISYKF